MKSLTLFTGQIRRTLVLQFAQIFIQLSDFHLNCSNSKLVIKPELEYRADKNLQPQGKRD